MDENKMAQIVQGIAKLGSMPTAHIAIIALLSCLGIGFVTIGNAESVGTAYFQSALEHPARTKGDRSQDEFRRPVDFLNFIGLHVGDTVIEYNAGGGYYARIYPSVVGENGHVYAVNSEFVLGLFEGIQDRLKASLADFDNVTTSIQPDGKLDLERSVDVVVLNNVYHDLHWQEIDVAQFNKELFGSLRPGGKLIVADHRAVPGSRTEYVGTLHRIGDEVIREELTAAGFVLTDENFTYRNEADDHLLFIMDPSIRGYTDRVLLKFVKPK